MRTRQPRPLTEHHMFAPLVALWFGALFSLSSLAVRTGLFEQMIVSIGVDRLFPYASPPLGHTARLLIAVVFGLVGAGIGSLLARVVAGGPLPGERPGDSFYPASGEHGDDYRVRARDAHPDAPARRPISASAELGEDSLGQDFGGKRVPTPWVPRALKTEEEDEAETPPLPEWFSAAPAEAEVVPAVPLAAPVAVEPVAEAPVPVEPVVEPAVEETVVEMPAIEILPPAEAREMAAAAAAGEMGDPDYPDAWRNTAERIAHAPPAALGHVELIERLAIALHNRSDDAAHPGANGQSVTGEIMKPATGPDAEATIQALRDALSSLRGG